MPRHTILTLSPLDGQTYREIGGREEKVSSAADETRRSFRYYLSLLGPPCLKYV